MWPSSGRNSTSIQLEVDGKHLIELCKIPDGFSKQFQSVYNNPCPVVFLTLCSHSEFLSLDPASDWGVFKTIKFLRPSKSTFSKQYFRTLWKQSAIATVFKKDNSGSVSNFKPVNLM
jgi:hypothetical protein